MRRLSQLVLPLALLLAPACSSSDTGPQEEWPEPQWPEMHSELPHDAAPSLDADEHQAFVRDNRLMALDLYHQLRQDSKFADQNLLFSPYSLRTAFGMLYGGAVGETREQIASVLHFSLDDERQHVAFNWLDDALANRQLPAEEAEYEGDRALDPVIVLPANGVWANEGIQHDLKLPYLDLLSVHYDTGVRLAKFGSDADKEAERIKINQWVEARTASSQIGGPGGV